MLHGYPILALRALLATELSGTLNPSAPPASPLTPSRALLGHCLRDMGQDYSQDHLESKKRAGRRKWLPPLSEPSPDATDGMLCSGCAKLPIEDPLQYIEPSRFFLDSVNGTYDGIRGSIKVDAGCTLCNIAVEAIRAQSDQVGQMVVQGFSYAFPTSLSRSFLVYCQEPTKHSPILTGRIRILKDDESLLPSQPRTSQKDFFGRRINDGQINFHLVRSWLHECERSAGHDCGIQLSEPTDIILIDVQANRLVRRRSDVRYLALSYVWGQAGQLQTVKENFSTLQKQGALCPERNDIPRTIADAMLLVRELHERYLWVDRLCIIQDSEMKHDTIQDMGKIYSHAILTLFALAGKDANHGLPGVRPNSRPRQTIRRVKGIHLMPALPDLGDALRTSLHTTRGWTFQEVLLSRRRLFLSDQQVYFHCTKHTIQSEDTPNTSSLSFEVAYGLREPKAKQYIMSEIFKLFEPESPRSVYEGLVEKYTQRHLTCPTDILDAFCGISSVLSHEYRMSGCEELLGGLPRREFLAYLLWSPKETPTRRMPRIKGRHEEHFPSWSWIGWMCPIYYARVDSQNIGPGMWLKEISTPCQIELLQPDGGAQQTVHQPLGHSYHGHPSWGIWYPMPPLDTSHDTVPHNGISKFPGRSLLHFVSLAIPATTFSYERWPHIPYRDADTRMPFCNAQGHPCGIFVGKTPSNLSQLLPECKHVFLCYAHVLVDDISLEYNLDDWINEEFDQAHCVSFFLLLHRHGELWERIALTIITWDAFESAQPEWENILLA
ncbi:hypothetical protein AbraIFM66951_010414 [Aspergillus brasiliensis]|uniref:Heterokaryon incompatibility domain-containing protein n=1 Tax=Aspergillus brasiliensis TaxID=319629 RepID=A0A9W5YVR7_9EURO|nr:hypothetical protein AbraCBS73388_010481 [Aspergillus brasiliensis]GKZ47072.1 hypothetical protein AbraIFM66951_010414 [Aspergillus brasiliensis]